MKTMNRALPGKKRHSLRNRKTNRREKLFHLALTTTSSKAQKYATLSLLLNSSFYIAGRVDK